MSPAGLLDRPAERTERTTTTSATAAMAATGTGRSAWAAAATPADRFGTPTASATDLPCRASTEDLWFSDSPAELERAKALCADCPLRRACLSGALERQEYCGVWGGEIVERGTVIARKKPRGRPSKADLARDAEIAAARAAAGVA